MTDSLTGKWMHNQVTWLRRINFCSSTGSFRTITYAQTWLMVVGLCVWWKDIWTIVSGRGSEASSIRMSTTTMEILFRVGKRMKRMVYLPSLQLSSKYLLPTGIQANKSHVSKRWRIWEWHATTLDHSCSNTRSPTVSKIKSVNRPTKCAHRVEKTISRIKIWTRRVASTNLRLNYSSEQIQAQCFAMILNCEIKVSFSSIIRILK